MKSKLLVIGAILVVVGGLWFLGNKDEKVDETTGQSNVLSNNTYSTGSSGVELVEYGDFECPSCAQFYPIVKEIKEKYKDTVTFRFRHFPLQTIHPNARAAHRAAEAASKQGKFWEMHDSLYESQSSWRGSSNAADVFRQFASQLNLDMAKYDTDVKSTETNGTINADYSEGENKGVQGTPTFFLDGKLIDNRDIDTIEKFSKLIDDAVAAKTGTQPASGSTEPTSTEQSAQ